MEKVLETGIMATDSDIHTYIIKEMEEELPLSSGKK